MAIYAVGDLQGCYDPLAKLLDRAAFDPQHDTLWCVGDLVNRGTQSLKVLRFLKSLGNQCVSVLGNHDIHLLAMAYGLRSPRPSDSLNKVLNAPDLSELMDWLRHRPLLVEDPKRKTLLCHAGIYPWWTRQQALDNAAEVEAILRDEPSCIKLLGKIYSNQPSKWQPTLGKTARRRFIINAFTRMRFCTPKGHLNLTESGYAGRIRKNRLPWFELTHPDFEQWRIIFGHWSALGLLNTPQHLCLDTGYIWGNQMTLVKISKTHKKKVKIFSIEHG